MEYVKFWFSNGEEKTAGIVLPLEKYRNKTITELSQCFPMRECTKMRILECSEVYPTFEAAFMHDIWKD